MQPGFPDPVAGAQTTFRAILDAMARPGTIHHAGADLSPPAPFTPAAAAALLTLLDHDAPLHLQNPAAEATDWLAFHTGAHTTAPAEAAFVFATTLPDLAALRPGTHETPEDSTTLILQLPALNTGRRYRLSGPGLAAPTIFRADGLPEAFPAIWAANNALFPCGVDLILCAGATLAALPRTTTVEPA